MRWPDRPTTCWSVGSGRLRCRSMIPVPGIVTLTRPQLASFSGASRPQACRVHGRARRATQRAPWLAQGTARATRRRSGFVRSLRSRLRDLRAHLLELLVRCSEGTLGSIEGRDRGVPQQLRPEALQRPVPSQYSVRTEVGSPRGDGAPRGSHGSGRAGLPHPALRSTASLRVHALNHARRRERVALEERLEAGPVHPRTL